MIKKSFTVIAGLDCVGKTSLYGILSGERIVTNNVDYSDTYCLDNNISFTQETTLSGHRTEKTIQQARKQGYYVIMYYVGLNSKEESLARAMGEFGAVSVISGHLRGKTNTLPLHVEILFNEFKYVPAFAVSSILVLMAIAILIIRSVVEYKGKKDA